MTNDGSRMDVVRPGPGRLGALAAVFGRAFVDEPMMRWPMGEVEDIAHRFTLCFSYFLERVLERGLVWEAATAKGAAVSIPPQEFDSWESHPWNQPRISALSNDGGRRYDAFWRWIDARTPDGPLWQLDSIAVDPEAQGQGYGAALIASGLGRAQSEGAGAFPRPVRPATCPSTNIADSGCSTTPPHPGAAPISGSSAGIPPKVS